MKLTHSPFLSLFSLIPLFLIYPLFSQIILTEIMFDPATSEYHDEFIEICNLSQTKAIDLTGWQITDSTGSENLIDAGEGMIIAPGQFAVILDGSYFGNSTTYNAVLPEKALIIRIDDNAFGKNGLSNSAARKISLIRSAGDTVQAYRYSLDNKPGYSDEKIVLNENNLPTNWSNSLPQGGTPGYRNSVTPFDLDLGVIGKALTYRPSILVRTLQTVTFTCVVTNSGLLPFSDSLHVLVFIDDDADSLADAGEWTAVDERVKINLAAGEKHEFSGSWLPQSAGRFIVAARIFSNGDQNPLNNFTSLELDVIESRETVHINEIKFLTFTAEPEWLEVVNSGNESLALTDWGIADMNDTVWIDTALFINPGQFKVLAADTGLAWFYEIADSQICVLRSLPTFNNDGDVVYLLNPTGGWVEQVPYSNDWLEGEDWRSPSLERIQIGMDSRQSSNWGPCTATAGGTPGKENSIHLIISTSNHGISVSPNPFSPDGDGFEDHVQISIESPTASARARIEIYDISGRKIRAIMDNSYIGSTISAIWNGHDDRGQRARMGIYIVWAQIIDDRNGVMKEYKASVVVAGKL